MNLSSVFLVQSPNFSLSFSLLFQWLQLLLVLLLLLLLFKFFYVLTRQTEGQEECICILFAPKLHTNNINSTPSAGKDWLHNMTVVWSAQEAYWTSRRSHYNLSVRPGLLTDRSSVNSPEDFSLHLPIYDDFRPRLVRVGKRPEYYDIPRGGADGECKAGTRRVLECQPNQVQPVIINW